ncbi:hypothetical protein [Rubrolithibacter danxiaensis]|uniref:hypothetical protein n=1 Tax=Rubrolithibacter danxiaensis TaxID=3390805 RepID=UPI003BF904BE
MTYDQFKNTIRRPSKFDDTLNYVTCIAFIAAGLFFAYRIYVDGFSHERGLEKYKILLLPLIFILPGLYGFWRISKDYEVVYISSDKPKSEKLEIINRYLSNLRVENQTITNDLIRCRYRNVFFNKVDLSIYIDEEKVLLNAQGVDQAGAKGFIDFGLTYRAARRLKTYMKASL